MYDGVIYHSKLEASFAAELDLRMRAGDMSHWERQIKLELKVRGIRITNYYIDFIIHHYDGHREFVEVKGMATEVWKLKWKLFEATFEDFKKHPDDVMLLVKQSSIRAR